MKPPLTVSTTNTIREQAGGTTGAFWNIALFAGIAGIFILYSRFFDLVANGLRIPRIVLSLMVVFFLLSGRLFVFLRSTAGKFLLGLCAWASVTVVTGVWKSGSIPPYYQLMQSTLIFAIAAGIPLTVKNVGSIMSTLAVSGLVAALMSIPWSSYEFGRLALMEGSYKDPNYYAMCLIAVVPFFWFMAQATRSYAVRIFTWASLAPIFIAIAKSGSRGAMLGFGAMVLIMLVISPGRTKLLISLATLTGVTIAALIMPSYIRARYFTFFDVDSATAEEFESSRSSTGHLSDLDRLHADMSSAVGRRRLLMTSIKLTFEHPVFGVGPGNFPTAAYDESKEGGHARNEWLATHNSYTEISSETGFPGLILFLGIIASGFRSLTSVLRRSKDTGVTPDPIAFATAKYLLLSLTSLSVCIFFLAVGYEFGIYLWVGLAVSLKRSFDEQLTARTEDGEAGVPQRIFPEKPVFPPAYVTVGKPSQPSRKQTVSGRRVRFNGFR